MSNPAAPFPLADADLCVKCGLCLPHCPTYRVSRHEADGPRGRIALMHGLATGLVGQTPVLEAHLDQCLACRACEAVCPADVPYGSLIDAGRELLARQRPGRAFPIRLLGWAVVPRMVRRGLWWLLWAGQRLGLMAAADLLPLGRRLRSLLPPLEKPVHWQEVYPARGSVRGRVALFLGCVGEVVESVALQDGIEVLTRFGYEVHLPPTQACCGALHLHNGIPDKARELAQRNLAAFADGFDAIVGTSSGCTATLREYDELAGAKGAALAAQVEDLGAFLNRVWPDNLAVRALSNHIAVHEPCTLRNVLRSGGSAKELLKRIPGLKVDALPSTGRCCGAAGSYFLTETGMADRLVGDQVADIRAMSPDAVVTSNVGCALHMGGALRRQGSGTPLSHPVSLLARQLRS